MTTAEPQDRDGELGSGVPYEPVADLRWTEGAFRLLEHGDLSGRAVTRDGVVSSHVSGACPRCGHQIHDRQVHTAVLPDVFRGDEHRGGGPPLLDVDVVCGCDRPHHGAPAGTAGCGVAFRVTLVLDGDRP